MSAGEMIQRQRIGAMVVVLLGSHGIHTAYNTRFTRRGLGAAGRAGGERDSL